MNTRNAMMIKMVKNENEFFFRSDFFLLLLEFFTRMDSFLTFLTFFERKKRPNKKI